MRRRQVAMVPATADGLPADLALGPCIEIWADPSHPCPSYSASRNWQDARDAWAAGQGLKLPGDYRHLPRALCARAPYYREARQ